MSCLTPDPLLLSTKTRPGQRPPSAAAAAYKPRHTRDPNRTVSRLVSKGVGRPRYQNSFLLLFSLVSVRGPPALGSTANSIRSPPSLSSTLHVEPAPDAGWRRPRGRSRPRSCRRPWEAETRKQTKSVSWKSGSFVVRLDALRCAAHLHLLAAKDQPLLDGRDALLLLDLLLDLGDLQWLRWRLVISLRAPAVA